MTEQTQPDVLPDVDQVIQRCIDAVRDADCPFFATTAINDAVYTIRLMQDHITQLAQRERPALTDEQRREMLDRLGAAAEGLDGDTWDQMVISATERAHGIGDPT